jgi:hypothetical protein
MQFFLFAFLYRECFFNDRIGEFESKIYCVHKKLATRSKVGNFIDTGAMDKYIHTQPEKEVEIPEDRLPISILKPS